jgi:hypothetical protein
VKNKSFHTKQFHQSVQLKTEEEPVVKEEQQKEPAVSVTEVTETVLPVSTLQVEEIKYVPEPVSIPVEPIIKPIKEVLPKKTNINQPKPLATKGAISVYNVEASLLSYSEAMDKSKVIAPEEGGKWQYNLYTTLMKIINNKEQETFNNEYNTMLLFMHNNREGVFNERYIFRFPEYWPGSDKEFIVFRRLIHVAITTANPKTRKSAMADILLDKATEDLSELQKQKLFNFYQ